MSNFDQQLAKIKAKSGAFIAALLALTFTGNLSLFGVLAFAPVLVRTFWSMFNPKVKVNLIRAGILEIAYSLVFLVCVALSFHNA